jgi:hypothetical protein
MPIAYDSAVTAEEVNEEQSHEVFDQACRRLLGVSAEEFLSYRDAGNYPAEWNTRAISEIEFLLPFAR